MGKGRGDGAHFTGTCPRLERKGKTELERGVHRWYLRHSQKGGRGVGKTKRGKGSKLMVMADGAGLPIAVCVTSATPHEVKLVEVTLEACWVPAWPKRLIGDRAYDSDGLDRCLAQKGIEMIALHRRHRRKPPTQDGRKLRRYRKRWKIERLFAWLGNFGRLLVRWERHVENFLGFVHLGCMLILLKRLL